MSTTPDTLTSGASQRPLLLASMAVLSWSTVATAFKIALASMTVFQMVAVAAFTAFCIFSLWMGVSGKWHELKNLRPKRWGRFALLGLIMPTAYYLMLFKAYDYLPAQVAQPINYIWPILLAVLLALLTRRPIPVRKYFGMAVSLGGVVVISTGGSAITGGISLPGIGMAIGSALLWALYWIINESLKNEVSEVTSLFLTFLFGLLWLALAFPFSGWQPIGVQEMLPGVYIGCFEMGLPFIFFGLALRTTDNPALVNQLCYLAPFLSLFLISMILGEEIVASTYIGLVLIIGGILYNQYSLKRLPLKTLSRKKC